MSVDLVRGQRLAEAASPGGDDAAVVRLVGPRLSRMQAADRLALTQWPAGHPIVVGSLDGGTGRTTVAGLIATILTELPYAHAHRPVARVDACDGRWSGTGDRWTNGTPLLADPSAAGSDLLATTPPLQVVDVPAGLPVPAQFQIPTASIVVVTRPDRRSLARLADALIDLHDERLLPRSRVCILINDGAGSTDAGSRAAATALCIRSVGVHRLPKMQQLGPGRSLPSGRAIPRHLSRLLTDLCLDLHRCTRTLTPASPEGELT